jgi:hypothetical protein
MLPHVLDARKRVPPLVQAIDAFAFRTLWKKKTAS